ncbi:MAG: isochorismatase family protein [Chloroflexota bacterium]|nr:isochorismatase family protein [Chloroflexota bacterium]
MVQLRLAVFALASTIVLAACAPATPAAATAAPSGVPTIPEPVAVQLDAATTAVLVLDITNVICTPRPACVQSVPKIAALLKKARDAKVALVAYSDTGGTSQVLPEVAPQTGDPKVSGRADKFFNTDLDKILKDKGIKTVVVTGSAAHGAVLYTTFGANERGMTAVVAVDGISVGTGAEAFGMTVAEWQVLNEPGFANATNKALDPGHVTLSRSDLVTFK